jgi:hypothetical protein
MRLTDRMNIGSTCEIMMAGMTYQAKCTNVSIDDLKCIAKSRQVRGESYGDEEQSEDTVLKRCCRVVEVQELNENGTRIRIELEDEREGDELTVRPTTREIEMWLNRRVKP